METLAISRREPQLKVPQKNRGGCHESGEPTTPAQRDVLQHARTCEYPVRASASNRDDCSGSTSEVRPINGFVRSSHPASRHGKDAGGVASSFAAASKTQNRLLYVGVPGYRVETRSVRSAANLSNTARAGRCCPPT